MGAATRLKIVATLSMVVAALVTRTAGQFNYCSLCSNHTLCIYKGIGSACSQVVDRGVDNATQLIILDEHNKYRNYVASGQETSGAPGPQPPAADMRKLIWDNELATIAQRWSDQCAFGHDSCRSVSRFYVGQNAYLIGPAPSLNAVNWKHVVQKWYSEVKDFNKNYVDTYVSDGKSGHYSQLVWGNTRYIGCGYTEYKKSGNSSQLYICNYGPGGNIKSQRVYTKGKSCSACSSGCDATYRSLCA